MITALSSKDAELSALRRLLTSTQGELDEYKANLTRTSATLRRTIQQGGADEHEAAAATFAEKEQAWADDLVDMQEQQVLLEGEMAAVKSALTANQTRCDGEIQELRQLHSQHEKKWAVKLAAAESAQVSEIS